MDIVNILPDWFKNFSLLLLSAVLLYALKRFFDFYTQSAKEDQQQSRELSKENTKNIAELLAITRVHEHRITKAEEDIEHLQDERIVRYKRNGNGK
jgi:hypothetical protein